MHTWREVNGFVKRMKRVCFSGRNEEILCLLRGKRNCVSADGSDPVCLHGREGSEAVFMKREGNRCVSVDGGKPVCVSRNKKDDVLLWRRKSIILSLKTGIEQVKIYNRYYTSNRS